MTPPDPLSAAVARALTDDVIQRGMEKWPELQGEHLAAERRYRIILSVLTALAPVIEQLERLVYVGDHHFSDLTWKSRCEEANARAESAESDRAALRARVEALEQKYRERLWLGHGHLGVYGDDGEMQCSECSPFGAWDYKREPIEVLESTIMRVAASRIREVSR